MSIQPLWLTHCIYFLLVLEFQLTKLIVVGTFSYKAHFRPQISSNACLLVLLVEYWVRDVVLRSPATLLSIQ